MASDKTLALLGKIKSKQWKAMGETVIGMRELVDAGGTGDFFSDLADSWSLEVEKALSPLKNEINDLINEALKPIMPLIKATLNEATEWIAISVGSWEAIITGEWDRVFQLISDKMPVAFKLWKNDINQFFYDMDKNIMNWLDDLAKKVTQWGKDVGKAWSSFWKSMGWT